MCAGRALCRSFQTILKMSAVSAVPYFQFRFLKYFTILNILHQFQISVLVGFLDLGHTVKEVCDAGKASRMLLIVLPNIGRLPSIINCLGRAAPIRLPEPPATITTPISAISVSYQIQVCYQLISGSLPPVATA